MSDENVEHEPGELIIETACPCCGASLRVEYGDDPGEIGILGESLDTDSPAAIFREEAAKQETAGWTCRMHPRKSYRTEDPKGGACSVWIPEKQGSCGGTLKRLIVAPEGK